MGYVNPRAHVAAAQIAADSVEMKAAGMKVKAVVLAVAAPHTKTGHYNSSIRVVRRGGASVKDTIVETTDPNAMQIEYGHWWITPEGVKVRWIQGLRIFNRAYDLLKKG